MSTKKTITEKAAPKSSLLNNVDKITATAKQINTQVLETIDELVEDTKNNGTQITDAVTTTLKNIQITDSLKKISKTAVNINSQVLETATEVASDVYQAAKSSVENIDINFNIPKNIDKLQTAVHKANQYVIDTAETLVEGTIKNGEKWQDVVAKAADKGTVLLGKQQELTLDTVEELIGQYKTGSVRLKKLLGIKSNPNTFLKGQADKAVNLAKQAKDKTVATVDELLDNAFDSVKEKTDAKIKKAAKGKATISANKALNKAIDTTKKVVKPVAKSAKGKIKQVKGKTSIAINEAVENVAAIVEETKAAVVKPAKKIAKPTKAKQAKATKSLKESNATPDNLEIIEGIGPKIEDLLNAAGIYTYQQLAATEVTAIKEILTAAGSRYTLHDPTTWGQQAALAAAGKWEALSVWKDSLKGGKEVK